jgi:RNA polymerase-associated protein
MSNTKRSVMILHSGASDIYSHRVRIVLAEKAITADILHTDLNNPPQNLLELNPYTVVPTLIDRDLVLYQPDIIIEYLDERFPHPPLLPVYPIARAKCRLMMHRIEQDWFAHVAKIEKGNKQEAEAATKDLREQLVTLAPLFAEMPFFLSEEYSLVDCCIAPLLWRLSKYGIELPKTAKQISEYGKRIFNRPAFQASLSDIEREMRDSNDF